MKAGDIVEYVDSSGAGDGPLIIGRLYRVLKRWDNPSFSDIIDVEDTTTGTVHTGWWDKRFIKNAVVNPTSYHSMQQGDAPKGDAVYHPPHYARWKMEPIEFIAINDLPWWLANVIKYTMRFDAKDGLKDLYKARSYLDMKIREVEGTQRFWDKPVSEERKLNAEG